MSILHASVGIDLGSSKFVVAVAKKGGVEVLTNDASYRQTPTLVSFGPERIVGDKAVQKIKKNINNSILLPPRWIGELSPQQLAFEKRYNFSKVQLDDQQHAVFNVNYEGNPLQAPAVQVLAGVFKEALEVMKMNQIMQNEAVVSVPGYLGQTERQAVIDAAKIAGLEITKLYNESAANVMNYGIFRMNDLDPKNPRLVAFVDMGHSKTTVIFANIWKDRAEIIKEVSDPNLGSRNLDIAMLDHYVAEFQAKHKVDLRESPKSCFRLLEAIEKQRKILTANPEAMLSVDCIYEDYDFNHMLKRDEFEQINKEFIAQFVNLMQNAIKELPADVAKTLQNVERVGGATRIPFVERLIAQTFKVEQVSKTLDAGESVARGCAIQAAMLSPLFKVPPYSIPEKLVNPVSIKLQYDGEEEKKKDLFKEGCEYGKSLSIVIQKPLGLKLALAVNNRFTGQEQVIAQAVLDKLNSKEEKFEGKVYLLLDRNGLAIIEKYELREVYIVEEKIPVKPAAGVTKDKPKEQPASPEDSTKMEIETPEPPKEEFTVEKKEKTRITNLQYNSRVNYGLERPAIDSFRQFESQVSQKEQAERELHQAKYAFESFIYNTRNALNLPTNSGFSLPQEKDKILADLQASESWLYDEGQNCAKQDYEKQLTKVRASASSFTTRMAKIEAAKNYYEEAVPAIKSYQSKNGELIAGGNQVQLNELNQKQKEAEEIISRFSTLFANFTLQNIDSFDFEGAKNALNKTYESMNNVLAAIKKDKEQAERDAKKKAEEEAKKKREDEEAKRKAEEELKKMATPKPKEQPEDTKMEIEK